MDLFRFRRGTSPLLVSMPHAGTYIPPEIRARLTEAAIALPDTDWHVDRLYDFLDDLGASVLVATHSRYVIDLNRPPDNANLYPGQDTTGLVPIDTVARASRVPARRDPGRARSGRTARAVLAAVSRRSSNGSCSASARSTATRCCGTRTRSRRRCRASSPAGCPDLNVGTAGGASCAPVHGRRGAGQRQRAAGYTAVLNGRFKGGYITRHYGRASRRACTRSSSSSRSGPTWTSRRRSTSARTWPRRSGRCCGRCWRPISGPQPGRREPRRHGARLAPVYSATWKSQPVFAFTSSSVTPGCSSFSTRPLGLDLEHAQVGDDHVDHALAGDRQRAALEDLRAAVLGGVLHQHDHAPARRRPGPSRRRAPSPSCPGTIQLARSPFSATSSAAEDRQVDVPAADHRERIGAGEEARARDRGDGLLAGVDQVRVDLVLGRERADAEQAVLRLQRDVDALRECSWPPASGCRCRG